MVRRSHPSPSMKRSPLYRPARPYSGRGNSPECLPSGLTRISASAPGLAAGQRPVEVVRPGAGEGGDDAGGGAGAGAGLDQVAQGVDGEADVAVVLLGGSRRDHEDD